jgi:hypothetical protein
MFYLPPRSRASTTGFTFALWLDANYLYCCVQYCKNQGNTSVESYVFIYLPSGHEGKSRSCLAEPGKHVWFGKQKEKPPILLIYYMNFQMLRSLFQKEVSGVK